MSWSDANAKYRWYTLSSLQHPAELNEIKQVTKGVVADLNARQPELIDLSGRGRPPLASLIPAPATSGAFLLGARHAPRRPVTLYNLPSGRLLRVGYGQNNAHYALKHWASRSRASGSQ
jgi:hypothetical protein